MALDAGNVNIRINAQTGDTKQRIDEVRNSLDSLSGASKLVQAAMATAVAVVASKAGDLAGNLYSSLVVPMQRASRDINSTGQAAQDQLSALGSAAASVADNIPIVGGLISGIIQGQTNLAVEEMAILNQYKEDLKGYVDEVATYADNVLTNSALTGFSTETVQVYEKLQGITDVDFSTITTGMRSFNEALKEANTGSGDAKDALDKLGVSLTDVDGNAKSVDEVWKEVIAAFQSTSGSLSESEQWSLAVELFGSRAAQGLMPITTNSDLSYDSLVELASEIGILNGTELDLAGSVQDLNDLKDAAEETTEQLMGLRLAEATNVKSEAELKAEKTLQDVIHGTATWEDYYSAKADAQWENKQFDDVTTKIAKQDKTIEDTITEIITGSSTKEEVDKKISEAVEEGVLPSGSYIPFNGETDLRNPSALYESYMQNPQDLEQVSEIAQAALSILDSDWFTTSYLGEKYINSPEYETMVNNLWEAKEGKVILSPEYVEKLKDFTTHESTYGGLETRQLNALDEIIFDGLQQLFYNGSVEDLFNAAYPQPTPEQKVAAAPATEPTTVYEGNVYGDNSGNTNSNNVTTNNYYNAGLSTGDAN